MVRRTKEQESANIRLVGEAPIAENQAVDVVIAGARAFVVALEGGEYWNDVEVVDDVLYVASARRASFSTT